MLKYKTTGKERAVDSHSASLDFRETDKVARQCSFVSSGVGSSKATVIFKNVSFPLAWPAEEYFDNRGEWREFKVVLILRSNDGQEIVSDPLEKINRTFSDLKFSQTFIFSNLGSDFSIEATLCAQRTDENATPTIVQSVSRSLGRKFGMSLKRYMSSSNTFNSKFFVEPEKDDLEKAQQDERIFRQLTPIGRTTFQLKNASLSGLIRVYRLQTECPELADRRLPQSALLPIFGNMCCQLFVQPMSLLQPLAQGTLDLYFIDDRLLLQKLSCVLQGGFLKCYNPNSVTQNEASSINIPIDENTEVVLTGFQTALKITLHDPKTDLQKRLMIIASSQGSFLGWKEAIKLQILDNQIWKEFSSFNHNSISIKSMAGLNLSLKNSISRYAQQFGTMPVIASDTRKFLQEQGFDLPIYRRSRRPLSTVFPKQIENDSLNSNHSISSKKPRPESDVLPNTYVINLRIGLDEEEANRNNDDAIRKISSTINPTTIISESESSSSSRKSSTGSSSTTKNARSTEKMPSAAQKPIISKHFQSSTLPIRTKVPPPVPPKPNITSQPRIIYSSDEVAMKHYKPPVPPRKLPPSQSFNQPRTYSPARPYSNTVSEITVTRL